MFHRCGRSYSAAGFLSIDATKIGLRYSIWTLPALVGIIKAQKQLSQNICFKVTQNTESKLLSRLHL